VAMTINMHGLNSNMGNMTVDVPALVSSNAGHLASRTWCAQPPMQGTRQPARGLSSDAGLVTAGERGKGCGARQLAPRHGDGVASGAHFFVFFNRSAGAGHPITRTCKWYFQVSATPSPATGNVFSDAGALPVLGNFVKN
jgi:hypothetical protein